MVYVKQQAEGILVGKPSGWAVIFDGFDEIWSGRTFKAGIQCNVGKTIIKHPPKSP